MSSENMPCFDLKSSMNEIPGLALIQEYVRSKKDQLFWDNILELTSIQQNASGKENDEVGDAISGTESARTVSRNSIRSEAQTEKRPLVSTRQHSSSDLDLFEVMSSKRICIIPLTDCKSLEDGRLVKYPLSNRGIDLQRVWFEDKSVESAVSEMTPEKLVAAPISKEQPNTNLADWRQSSEIHGALSTHFVKHKSDILSAKADSIESSEIHSTSSFDKVERKSQTVNGNADLIQSSKIHSTFSTDKVGDESDILNVDASSQISVPHGEVFQTSDSVSIAATSEVTVELEISNKGTVNSDEIQMPNTASDSGTSEPLPKRQNHSKSAKKVHRKLRACQTSDPVDNAETSEVAVNSDAFESSNITSDSGTSEPVLKRRKHSKSAKIRHRKSRACQTSDFVDNAVTSEKIVDSETQFNAAINSDAIESLNTTSDSGTSEPVPKKRKHSKSTRKGHRNSRASQTSDPVDNAETSQKIVDSEAQSKVAINSDGIESSNTTPDSGTSEPVPKRRKYFESAKKNDRKSRACQTSDFVDNAVTSEKIVDSETQFNAAINSDAIESLNTTSDSGTSEPVPKKRKHSKSTRKGHRNSRASQTSDHVHNAETSQKIVDSERPSKAAINSDGIESSNTTPDSDTSKPLPKRRNHFKSAKKSDRKSRASRTSDPVHNTETSQKIVDSERPSKAAINSDANDHNTPCSSNEELEKELRNLSDTDVDLRIGNTRHANSSGSTLTKSVEFKQTTRTTSMKVSKTSSRKKQSSAHLKPRFGKFRLPAAELFAITTPQKRTAWRPNMPYSRLPSNDTFTPKAITFDEEKSNEKCLERVDHAQVNKVVVSSVKTVQHHESIKRTNTSTFVTELNSTTDTAASITESKDDPGNRLLETVCKVVNNKDSLPSVFPTLSLSTDLFDQNVDLPLPDVNQIKEQSTASSLPDQESVQEAITESSTLGSDKLPESRIEPLITDNANAKESTPEASDINSSAISVPNSDHLDFAVITDEVPENDCSPPKRARLKFVPRRSSIPIQGELCHNGTVQETKKRQCIGCSTQCSTNVIVDYSGQFGSNQNNLSVGKSSIGSGSDKDYGNVLAAAFKNMWPELSASQSAESPRVNGMEVCRDLPHLLNYFTNGPLPQNPIQRKIFDELDFATSCGILSLLGNEEELSMFHQLNRNYAFSTDRALVFTIALLKQSLRNVNTMKF